MFAQGANDYPWNQLNIRQKVTIPLPKIKSAFCSRVVVYHNANSKLAKSPAKRSGMLGRKGKLEISLKDVTLVSGERVSLRAEQKGGGGTSGGIIALAVVITPLALLFKGKNRTYEAGTEVLAFVDGNFKLEPDKFKPRFR